MIRADESQRKRVRLRVLPGAMSSQRTCCASSADGARPIDVEAMLRVRADANVDLESCLIALVDGETSKWQPTKAFAPTGKWANAALIGDAIIPPGRSLRLGVEVAGGGAVELSAISGGNCNLRARLRQDPDAPRF